MLLIFLLPSVLFFVLLLRLLFENQHNNKWNWKLADNEQKIIKTEALIVNIPSRDWTAFTLWGWCCLMFYFFMLLLRWIFENQRDNKWHWRLVENKQNIRTAEELTVSTPSGDWTVLTLYYFCFCCSLFCAVTANIYSIKTGPRSF